MSMRMLVGTLAAVLFVTVSLAGQGSGTYQVPRTPWGDPDLQGIWNGNDLQGVPMQRAESLGTRNILTDDEWAQRVANRDRQVEQDNAEFSLDVAEEFARFGTVGGPVSPPPHWLERANNVSRLGSFLIDPPNGRLPALTEEARRLQQERNAEAAERRARREGREADHWTDRSLYDRCISFGPLGSLTPKIYNSGNRIVQGPGWLAFSNEMINETRVIPTDGRRNVGAGIVSWMGNSVGRWEGDTLVVETRNVRPEINFQGAPLSSEGRLIERFRRISDDILEYQMTVDDPKHWERPWTMSMPLPRDDDYLFAEYACHEGNYSMTNILAGSRADEQRQREAAAQGLPNPLQPAGGRGGGGAGRGGGGRGGGAPQP
jgi:hypothetical protein